MTHPITPPPELVQQWAQIQAAEQAVVDHWQHIATRAAQWGADQELEACCEWLDRRLFGRDEIRQLHAARRPKPPSLKEQALETLKYPKDLWSENEVDTIRRALESIND